jgi:hypothetical protein
MKHIKLFENFVNEGKPKDAPDFHHSDAPEAEGRFRDLSPKELAAWLIKTRNKDLKKISGSLTQQVVFNRNEDPEYADKMERTRKEVYKQLGREDLLDKMDESIQEGIIKVDINRLLTKIAGAIGYKGNPKMRQELLDAFKEDLKQIMVKYDYVVEAEDHEIGMAMGQLDAIHNAASELEDKIFKEGDERNIPAWIQSHITSAYEYLKQANDNFHELEEAKAKPGPDAYMTGLDKETEEEKEEQMKKQAEMDDDNPDAYKELPGDEEAREKGQVKTSKHVKKYHELYGEETDESITNESIRVGKVVAIKKYNPKSNRYERVDVRITDYIKRPGSKDFVEYELKGKKRKVAFKVFNSMMESLNEEKAKGDRGPLDNKSIESALKKKSEETGVPIELIRIVMRRGLAAWKSGHRPGAGQEQWGYARVNSFLTKQEGTWGGADSDVAKEVRDGGWDTKLKKA